MEFTYHNPVQIYFGQGEIEKINYVLKGRRALIITSKTFSHNGSTDFVVKKTSNITSIIDSVTANPDIIQLEKLYDLALKEEFDVIIGIGGGSVIDSAKVISVYDETKSFKLIKDILFSSSPYISYRVKPIIAIPTTAGTGSEVTPWATVWDYSEKKKYSLHLPDLWPESCICDPLLTTTLSKDMTVQTGLDALSHCLESIWNKNANPISTQYAINGAKIIMKILPSLVNDLENIYYREQMMYAALSAGLAFSNTQTAIAHAISYYLTIHKQIPHGIACSFSLPLIIDSIIGRNLEVDNALEKIFGDLSVKKIQILFDQLNMSTRFSDYLSDVKEINELRSMLIGNSRANNSIININELGV